MSSTYLRVLTRVKWIRENKFTNVYHPCNTWKYPKDVTQRGGLELWLIQILQQRNDRTGESGFSRFLRVTNYEKVNIWRVTNRLTFVCRFFFGVISGINLFSVFR